VNEHAAGMEAFDDQTVVVARIADKPGDGGRAGSSSPNQAGAGNRA
jgi:hypothetical protein